MRLLILTHTFPPSQHANAKRPGYIVDALLKAGWQVDVFTSPLGMKSGAPETFVHPSLRIFRENILADRFLGRLGGFPKLHKMAALLLEGLSWPDSYNQWVFKATRLSRRLGPYDRTLAFVIPASMMLTGLRRGSVGPSWVFDYQESVTPYLQHHGRRSPLKQGLRPALASLERKTLHQAGGVIFTANTNRLAYIREGLVEEQRTAHVPYFFDAPVFSTPAPALAKGFHIVYFGTFDWYGDRTPKTFLHSLKGFLEKHPEARPETRFVFYGSWLPGHNELVASQGLEDVVEIKPAVAYSDYIERLRSAPVLLLIVAEAHNLFMPSKIVDYFGARRPILAFVPPESEMADVLSQAGMAEFSCAERDSVAGVTALERLWDRYRKGRICVDASQVSFWSSETQLPKYMTLLEG